LDAYNSIILFTQVVGSKAKILFDCHLKPLMIEAFKGVLSTKSVIFIPALAQKKNNFDILKIFFYLEFTGFF